MKKIIVTTLLFSLLFQGLIFGQEKFATIIKKNGNVNIRRVTETEYLEEAKVSSALNNGDAIKTDDQGFAALIFDSDKSLLKIRQNSELEIKKEFSVRTVKMTKGRILSKITPGATTSFRIETPTSVASVKGTDFLVICSPEFGDRFIGISGIVEIINLITGTAVNLEAGQMIISTPDGQCINMPCEEEDIPNYEDEPEPQPEPIEPLQEQDQPEPSGEIIDTPQTIVPADTTDPSMSMDTGLAKPVEEEIKPDDEGKNFGMGLGLGSVTIDGKIYNQIALRPEMKFGKLGIGLDVAFYMDDQGKIRKDEWDEFADYLDKIYYLRWGKPGDPLFVKAGAMDNVVLGYGILMNGYSNTTEYPQIRKIGIHAGMKYDKLGWEVFIANLKEIRGPGLMAGRLTYKPMENTPLILGSSIVMDIKPYLGLPDSDDDGVADALDLYRDRDDNRVIDTLRNDFSLNERDFLRNNGLNIPTEDIIASGITKLGDYDRHLNGAVSFDVGIPIVQKDNFNIVTYGEFARFLPITDSSYNDISNPTEFKPGWGISFPGIKANILKILNISLEYRMAGRNFMYGYWDRLYDFERVQVRNNQIFTKQQLSLMQDPMKGLFGSVNVNILNYVILSSYYQQMTGDNGKIKSFSASASIPKKKIPKLYEAVAFYQRNNDENPFKFKSPSGNTILGYNVGFELGGGAVLYYRFQKTYRDTDGNGSIDPDTEGISLTTIETGFNF